MGVVVIVQKLRKVTSFSGSVRGMVMGRLPRFLK